MLINNNGCETLGGLDLLSTIQIMENRMQGGLRYMQSLIIWLTGMLRLSIRTEENPTEVMDMERRTAVTAEQERELANQRAEKMLEQYGNSILRLAYSYMHSLSDAEDVLQDTLIQYMRSAPPSFNGASHEKAWLLRVAINQCKNRLRYNQRRQTTELDEGLIADEEEDLRFVWEAVTKLPQMYSEVMHLFYEEGYPTAKIAEILGKKETTIRSLLHRAREKLKLILKEEYDFAE